MTNSIRVLLLAFSTICVASLAMGQTVDEDLRAQLEALRSDSGAPAIAALVMVDGDVRAEVVVGVRAVGKDTPAEPGDLWHLGSVTKSMTATLVARLTERGDVSWDMTVQDALGQAITDIDPAFQAVTFRELLSHSAGLPANIGMFKFLNYDRVRADARAERLDYASHMLSRTPDYVPGEGYAYSNAGYIIVGAMLEQRLGARWEDLIADHVFAPLGIESAGFGPVGAGVALSQPRGHGPLFLGFGRRAVSPNSGRADNPEVLGPAGRVHMNLEDLAIYGTAHITGSAPDGAPFLSAESLKILHTPRRENYAMGWVVRDQRLWHNGSNTINYAELHVDLSTGTVLAFAANDHDVAPLRDGFKAIAAQVYSSQSD
jgi:D-alanyl-D-alanine carboxypeptidase